MPIARRDDLRLHYELTPAGGREAGIPVLLVMGLGVSATGWWRTVPILAESRPVIAFDNRGVGRSDRVPGPYSTPQMADDAIAVLDVAGFERAHVYGISLGGMIAQEIVLRHPDRVAGLVLGATAAGGPDAIPPDEATLAFFRRRAEMPASEAVWASVPYSYGSTTRREHAQRIADDLEQRLRYPVEPEPYVAQLTAALWHDACRRLGEVDTPTLVVHGDEDQLVPAANAGLLAAAIPGSKLELWPGASHIYPTDEPEADRSVARFLAEAEGRRQLAG
ncbi:MAG: alpha/beta fold hydrolase [Thermoleophilaceae bacterium]|jgi:pimeloyl-ACP methyl ester carboxylesterase|nr:alpha/beta fold hydrolase [Thermoleophilaceae bacterium]MDQ3240965.1 alpha/beta hydrolase [Actinomycetota bacterium]MDQ3320692.1 alpha/beta hydrolase [Actinomycetota bacterium]MDQ3355162.1 alpha/beta hydrolase [Actinomycetota bacterium]